MDNTIQIEIEVNQDKGVNMKKIEKNMMDAIHNRKDWSNGNTSVNRFYVNNFEGVQTEVRLHGNLIAIITDIKTDSWQRNDIELNTTFGTITKPVTYRTNVTKSRLNALLAYTPFKIVQKNSQWFVHSNITGHMMPFYDEVKLPY